MTKRKKRRFGSPPERHKESMKKWLVASRIAKNKFNRALRAFRPDKYLCSNALEELVYFSRFSARAASESAGAGGRSRARSLSHAGTRMRSRFAKKCLK